MVTTSDGLSAHVPASARFHYRTSDGCARETLGQRLTRYAGNVVLALGASAAVLSIGSCATRERIPLSPEYLRLSRLESDWSLFDPDFEPQGELAQRKHAEALVRYRDIEPELTALRANPALALEVQKHSEQDDADMLGGLAFFGGLGLLGAGASLRDRAFSYTPCPEHAPSADPISQGRMGGSSI